MYKRDQNQIFRIISNYQNLSEVFETLKNKISNFSEGGNTFNLSCKEQREIEIELTTFDYSNILIRFSLLIDNNNTNLGKLEFNKLSHEDDHVIFWTVFFDPMGNFREELKVERLNVLLNINVGGDIEFFIALLHDRYLKLCESSNNDI